MSVTVMLLIRYALKMYFYVIQYYCIHDMLDNLDTEKHVLLGICLNIGYYGFQVPTTYILHGYNVKYVKYY